MTTKYLTKRCGRCGSYKIREILQDGQVVKYYCAACDRELLPNEVVSMNGVGRKIHVVES